MRRDQIAPPPSIIGADTKPGARPARMYLRSFYFNSQEQRRMRVVALPLVLALVGESGSRYSLRDPRDPPPAPPKPPAMRKPPPSSSGNQDDRAARCFM